MKRLYNWIPRFALNDSFFVSFFKITKCVCLWIWWFYG